MSSSQFRSSPGSRGVEVDVFDERDVLLVREAVPGEELGVERLDLLGLGVRELVAVGLVGHVLHRPQVGDLRRQLSSSSSALIASSRLTSARISCSVWPTV